MAPPDPSRVRHLPRPSVGDVALTLLCVAAIHLEIPLNDKAEWNVLGSVAIVAASLPVLIRRFYPVVAFVAAFVLLLGIIGSDIGVYNTLAGPVVLCAYALAERYGRRGAILAGALSMPATLAILQIFSPHPLLSWGTAQNLALVVLPLALGVAAHDRRAYTGALIDRAEAAERSSDAEALRRVGEERLRIARDVHDVVAHAMVTINVQAGVGAHLLDRDPAQAYATLRTIKQVSGDALADLRAMLGILRADDDAVATPVQRLADLPALVENLRTAGLDLTVEVDPATGSLPASVDSTGYRIVQEALTNTLRHAGPTSVRIRVVRSGDRIAIEVLDQGGTPVALLSGTGSGNGLRGMRERATALGGWLEAGPLPEGGWRVAASLPAEVRAS